MTKFRGSQDGLLSIIKVLTFSTHNLVVLMTFSSNQHQIPFFGQCNGLAYGLPSIRFNKIS